MFFVTIILVVLSLTMYIWGVRSHSDDKKNLGVILFIGALGTGAIEYMAAGLLY